MEFPARFTPRRQPGLILHAALVLALSLAGGFGLWYALQRPEGASIIGWLLGSVVLLIPVPFFIYRAYALFLSRYMLDRDGLRVRWGLRAEDIPMVDVEWIRPAHDLGYPLRLPFFRWPGSLYGKRKTEGLGSVDFIASDVEHLLLIATPNIVYAVSPEDTNQFLNSFLRAMELGSLSPLPPSSMRPTAFFKRIWADRAARLLVFAGGFATILLVVVTSSLVSARDSLPLGFDAQGQPFPPGPSEYVLLLPILGSILFAFNLLAGMFFYRQPDQQPISYLLWGTGILTPILLLLGVFLMSR